MKTLAKYTHSENNYLVSNATFGCFNKLLSLNYILYINYNDTLDNEHRGTLVK